MKKQFAKLALTASLALALACAFGCSDDNSSGNGNSNDNKLEFTNYRPIANITESSFTFATYSCNENNGTLERAPESNQTLYSIENNVLTFPEYIHNSEYSFRYSGNSNKLIGTVWTGTDNIERNAVPVSGDGNLDYDYGIKNIEFTESALIVKGVANFCATDELESGESAASFLFLQLNDEWKYKVADCRNFEIINGAEKIKAKWKINMSDAETPADVFLLELIYNGKTCIAPQMRLQYSPAIYFEKACKKSYETGESYNDAVRIPLLEKSEEYKKCINDNNFPGKF